MEEDKLDRKEDVADPKDVSSFVGGGPSSGQEVTAVVDKDNVDRTIESLFERARVVVPGKDVSNVQAFYGYGRRIGHTSDTSLFISPVVREQRTVNIYVYRDGYIIDNGPLFDKQGKDSAEFFNAIAQGYIPGRLEAMYPETDISVRLTDYTDVDYKDARESFPGCGKRLDEHVSTSAVAQKARGGEKSTTGSVPVFQLHEGEETAKLAIVNLVGDRQVFTVNPKRHTVEDVYQVAAKFSQVRVGMFKLLIRDVPPRPLEGKCLTIAEAKIENCTLMVRGV